MGGKNCYQINKGQYITINTTPDTTKYTMIFNIYVDSKSIGNLLLILLAYHIPHYFLKPTSGFFGRGTIGYSDYKVPTDKWCKIIFTCDQRSSQIKSNLKYYDNGEIVNKPFTHNSSDSEISNIFTLKNTAKLFYCKDGYDETIYTNYFKLIENHIMTDSEIDLLPL